MLNLLEDPSKSDGVSKTSQKIKYAYVLAPLGVQKALKCRFGGGLKDCMDFEPNLIKQLMFFYASDPPKLLENIEPGALSTFSRNIEFSMKTAPRNESKINTEIITNPPTLSERSSVLEFALNCLRLSLVMVEDPISDIVPSY